MALRPRRPTDAFQRLREAVDGLFSEAGELSFQSPVSPEGRWTPAMDVYEGSAQIALEVEMPGVRREDIQVRVTRNSLTIAGQRRLAPGSPVEHFHRIERNYGRFSRSFSIGVSVAPEGARAKLEDGVLRLELPKCEQAGPQEIKIDVAD
ncbi:MAG: Hsp20/alpha crystallin family protein [Armatimonadota bacterium]